MSPLILRRYIYNLLLIFSLIIFTVFLSISALSLRIYRAYNIPSKEELMQLRTTGIVLLDRKGREFFSFDRPGRRTIIPLSTIPPIVQQAVMAAEDRNFMQHWGFSPTGLLRSLYLDIHQHVWTYGGSTITQQVAKNILLNPRKSINRKFQEIIVAFKLEQHYSKADILEIYLNSAYFGANAFGIEEAAQTYFNKSASELSLSEASLLVGLLPAPTALSPLNNEPAPSLARQQYVLHRMVEDGYITSQEAQAAEKTPLALRTEPINQNIHAPHFALMVRQALINTFGESYLNRMGMVVTTTLDLDWQLKAEQLVKEQVATLHTQNAHNGALVAIDPTNGEVRALVGSQDWWDNQSGKVNMATSPRQPGSSFKPIVYATALGERIVTPTTILQDRPTTFGTNYRPQNYDGRYHGSVAVRYALANSLNIPAVETITKVGPTAVATLASRLGLSTVAPTTANLSLALGTEPVSLLELTDVYATFANQGLYHAPQLITSIRNKYDQPIPWQTTSAKNVLSPAVTFLISSMLSDNPIRQQTFGQALTISRPAAVKTGTTQNWRDAWTLGYTPQLAVGVWIGNNNNTPMYQLAGALGAAPIWRQAMEAFLQNQPIMAFSPPTGVVSRQVCARGGLLTVGSAGGYTEYFLAGTEPTTYCHPPATSTPPPTLVDNSPLPTITPNKIPKATPTTLQLSDGSTE